MKALSTIKSYLRITIIILMINSANWATAATIISKASGNWSAPATWKNGVVPVATDDVVVDGLIVLDGNFTCHNLTINNGTGRLTVNPGTALSINVLTNNRILEIISNDAGSGSVIYNSVGGSGTLYFERYMNGTVNGTKNFHLFSSPVSDCEYSNFFDNVNGNGKTVESNSDGTMFSLGQYFDNTNKWEYLFRKDKVGISGQFILGKGYSVALKTDNKVRMTGYPSDSSITVPITYSTGTKPDGGFGWNSLGNPFTASISVSSFYETNIGQLHPIYGGLYFWNSETASYDVISRGGGMTHIQVGQGFIARSKEGGGNITFNYTMREHATAATFKSAVIPWPSIELKASTTGLSRTTMVTFNSEMTSGLDPSYDAGVLKSGGGLELYTRLVEDNGSDYAIQCLPDVGLDTMVIPVSLDLTTGGEVTFTATSANLPAGCVPVLEDRLTGISTTLTTDGASYKVTLPSNTSGIKRFYLHLSDTKTAPTVAVKADVAVAATIPPNSSIINQNLARIKVYPIGREIHIQGVVGDQNVATLYDITGRSIGVYPLQAADNITLYPEGINNGIYLLRIVQGNAQRFVGKMILR
jgi:hypothetical protein